MYIRVKRKAATYFIHFEPSEKVAQALQNLHVLTGVSKERLRLILVSSNTVLDPAKSFAEQRVLEDDKILFYCRHYSIRHIV